MSETVFHPVWGTIIGLVLIVASIRLHRKWNAGQVLAVSDFWKQHELPKHEREQAKLR
jgi:hypothetical protein